MKIFKNKYFSFFIKVSILLLLLYTTYLQVFEHNKNQKDFLNSFLVNFNFKTICLLIFAIGLMFCNWLVEALKWKKLMKNTENLNLQKSLKAIFAGVTLSLFTPNRIGEYGGRMLFVKKQNRAKAIETSILCSLSQQIAIVFVGVFALTIYYFLLDVAINYFLIVILFSTIYLIFITIVYFKIELVKKYFSNFKRINKWLKPLFESEKFNNKALLQVLIFSFLRYFIFCTQLILLIYFFNIEIKLKIAYIFAAVLFLFQTLIPSVALIEIGIRGNIAVYLFKLLNIYSFSIVNAILLLWILNLLFPALIGWLIILKTKFIGQENKI